jgi:hypothetical protein
VDVVAGCLVARERLSAPCPPLTWPKGRPSQASCAGFVGKTAWVRPAGVEKGDRAHVRRAAEDLAREAPEPRLERVQRARRLDHPAHAVQERQALSEEALQERLRLERLRRGLLAVLAEEDAVEVGKTGEPDREERDQGQTPERRAGDAVARCRHAALTSSGARPDGCADRRGTGRRHVWSSHRGRVDMCPTAANDAPAGRSTGRRPRRHVSTTRRNDAGGEEKNPTVAQRPWGADRHGRYKTRTCDLHDVNVAL